VGVVLKKEEVKARVGPERKKKKKKPEC
jgi:hypothetical protein